MTRDRGDVSGPLCCSRIRCTCSVDLHLGEFHLLTLRRFQCKAATVRAQVSEGTYFRFFMTIKAFAPSGDVANIQDSPLCRSPFAADIKGELHSFGDNPGKGADFQGNAENPCGIFACGVLDGQVDDILREAEFVQIVMSKIISQESRTVLINIMKGPYKKQGNSEQRVVMKQDI